MDQLPRSDYARSLAWLPLDKLPAHVRLMVSASTDSEVLAAILAQFDSPYRAHLDPMPTAEAGSILDLWLEDVRRTLQPEQRESLLRSFRASGLPLHLRLAFEQARLYRSFDPLPTPGSDIVQTIRQTLAWLSSPGNHGAALVRSSLSFLTAAKDGLSEEELTDVLSIDTAVMTDFRHRYPHSPHADQLPMIIWSRLYYDLKPYLTERDAQGTPVFNYFHRQLREAITAEYLPPEEEEQRHKALASYFQAKPNFHGENGGRACDARKLSELPYQQRKAAMWEELEATLSDLAFIEAKCAAGLIYDLLADYDAALLKSGLTEAQKSRVASFGRFVRAQAHLLSTHPHLTLQQALNEPDCFTPAQAAAGAARQDSRPRFRLINKPQEASPCVMTLYGHTSYVNSCDISPDQTKIASASSDMEIKIWDAASGKELQALRGHTAPVEGCSFSPDGLRVISGARNGEVKLWEVTSGDESWSGAHHEPVATCRFSPKGERVVSASWDGTLKVWDAGTGAGLLTVHAHQGALYSCEFSPDGARIASAGGDGTLKLWDAATGEEIRSVAAHKLAIMCCRFAGQGAHLFTASQDMTLKRWDAATLQELNLYEGPESFTWAAAVSPNGDRLVSGSADGSIRLFDVESGATLGVIQEHTNEVWELAFFTDGARFVSASWDGTLKIWDAGALERRQKPVEAPHTGEAQLWGYPITCCSSPDGRRHAAGSSDGSIRMWDAVTGRMTGTFPLHNDFVFCCAFSPDSRWLVSGAWNGRLKIFDARQQRISDEASDPNQKTISFCAFTGDGKRVIACSEAAIRIWTFEAGKLSEEVTWSAGQDEKEHFAGCAVMPGGDSIIALRNDHFEIWDIASRQIVGSIPGQSRVQVFTLCPKGQILAALADDGSIRLWNVATRTLLREFGHGGPQAVSCNFSPNGNRLVLGLRDHTVSVWDLKGAGTPMFLTGHADELQDAGFSPNGKRILSASVDGTLRLWDAESGASLGTLLWPADSASTCVWSPGAASAVTASHRHCIKVWNGANGRLERILSGHTGTVLDCKFSAQGSLLSASADGTLRLWDPARGELLSWQGHDGPVRACDFSPDGNWIVSVGHDRSLRLWDARTGAPLGVLEGHEDWATLVRVVAEGRLILSGSLDKTVRIWDSASRQLVNTLHAHQAPVSALAANPDCSRVVSGDEKGVIHMWSVASGSLEGTLSGHTGPIRACVWPGAIVSASEDGTLRLWDAETTSTRAEFTHQGPVHACAVSPDGRLVASGSDDQFIKVWDLATGRRLGDYWAGSAVRSLSWGRNGRHLAAGVATGRLHLLDWEEGSR